MEKVPIEQAVIQARAEVLAAVYDQWAQVSQVIISRIGNAIDLLNDGQIGKARNELIIAEGSIDDCAKRMRTVQPAVADLEALRERAYQAGAEISAIALLKALTEGGDFAVGSPLDKVMKRVKALLREAKVETLLFFESLVKAAIRNANDENVSRVAIIIPLHEVLNLAKAELEKARVEGKG